MMKIAEINIALSSETEYRSEIATYADTCVRSYILEPCTATAEL